MVWEREEEESVLDLVVRIYTLAHMRRCCIYIVHTATASSTFASCMTERNACRLLVHKPCRVVCSIEAGTNRLQTKRYRLLASKQSIKRRVSFARLSNLRPFVAKMTRLIDRLTEVLRSPYRHHAVRMQVTNGRLRLLAGIVNARA